MTNPLTLREGDPPRLIRLRSELAEALAAAGVVQATRTDRPDWWMLGATTRVGVVNIDALQVVIRPKIDISRLVFLMGYARNPRFWRDDTVRLGPAEALPEALADAFVRLAHRAVEQGLLKGYHSVDDASYVLRGRIREADQLRTHWGRSIPLEVRYDDFTVDVPENQVLLAAAERLLRTPGVGRQHRAGLQRLRLLLADVTVPLAGGHRPEWTASRLNARYVPALELAELILDGDSFEHRVGDLVVSGYLFNMATVFEDFVTVALRDALVPHGGRSVLQYPTFLDEAETVPIRPDLVWLVDGVPQLVVDAKYKAEKPSGFPQADLYQMLAYCTVLELPVGHLVYAKGNEPARVHEVRHEGTRLMAHTVDLSSNLAALRESIRVLANQMVPG